MNQFFPPTCHHNESSEPSDYMNIKPLKSFLVSETNDSHTQTVLRQLNFPVNCNRLGMT